MENILEEHKKSEGIFTPGFIKSFREIFRPVSFVLYKMGVTPNHVTIASFFLAIVCSIYLALDRLWLGLFIGLIAGFSDIIDGQLAKDYYTPTKLGGILDSVIDRYNEFFVYAGLGFRYYILERPFWVLLSAFVFLGSVMISYVKARAEADGVSCKVGKFQRPERLAVMAVGLLFLDIGVDVAVILLAVLTQWTVLQRFMYVSRELLNNKS